MRWPISVLLVLALGGLPVADARAQSAPTKRDRQGPVTVTVNPVAPVASDASLRVKVALDTHSIALDEITLETVVFLKALDGALRIVVRDVGGVAERVFSWESWPAR